MDAEELMHLFKGFDIQQQCYFTWICGIRALPFLSAKRSFAYWPQNERKNNVNNIFNALDICAQAALLDEYTNVTTPLFDVANVARDYAERSATDKADAQAAHTAYFATSAVAGAALVAAGDHFIIRYTAESVIAATKAVANAPYEFKKYFFNDLESIKKQEYEFEGDKSLYGKLWNNFQDDLTAIGCASWANFYDELFDDDFAIDEAELRSRVLQYSV